MATALVSLITGRKVKPHLGMTGEITLRGQVLPVGGIKEKVLAAHRNGLKTIVLPKRNQYDLEDVPDEIKTSMTFIAVETMDDVLQAALEPSPARPRTAPGATPAKRLSRNPRGNVKNRTRRR